MIVAADLAENSAVRGCMVIKNRGDIYTIWELISKRILDRRFKRLGMLMLIFHY